MIDGTTYQFRGDGIYYSFDKVQYNLLSKYKYIEYVFNEGILQDYASLKCPTDASGMQSEYASIENNQIILSKPVTNMYKGVTFTIDGTKYRTIIIDYNIGNERKTVSYSLADVQNQTVSLWVQNYNGIMWQFSISINSQVINSTGTTMIENKPAYSILINSIILN